MCMVRKNTNPQTTTWFVLTEVPSHGLFVYLLFTYPVICSKLNLLLANIHVYKATLPANCFVTAKCVRNT